MIYETSLKKRKQVLMNYCRQSKYWRRKRIIRMILLIIAFTIIFSSLCGVIWATINFGFFNAGTGLFLATGTIFSFIPLIISVSIKNTSYYKGAAPYSAYANGILHLENDKLKYVFWCASPHEPSAYSSKHAIYHDGSEFTYSIKKNDITSIDFKDNICFIKGNGRIDIPYGLGNVDSIGKIDIFDKGVKLSKYIKKENNEFSFALTFEEDAKEELIKWYGGK